MHLPRAFPGGLLRRMRTRDLAAFQAYRSLPELGRFQGWSPMSETEALSFLAEMSEARLFAAGEWVQLGIATAAVRQALQLLFEITLVKRVLGVTDRRNVRSVRLLERVGFRHCESRSTVFRGEPCVEDVYALSRDDG